MEFKDRAAWERRVNNPELQDEYSKGVHEYASKWAEVMEAKITAGARIADIADPTSLKLASEYGYTANMHYHAVLILREVWVHGKELFEFHRARDARMRENAVRPK